jgi:hypothetical protein
MHQVADARAKTCRSKYNNLYLTKEVHGIKDKW